MFSHTEILQKAYLLTMGWPMLWVFGLFVMGGSSLNFLHFKEIPFSQLRLGGSWEFVSLYLRGNPESLAAVSFSLLLVSLGGFLLTNWCRIMLILCSKSILDSSHPEISEQAKSSRKVVVPVLKVSALTSVIMVLAAAALFLAPLLSRIDFPTKTSLWGVAVFIFIAVAFTVSFINIFTTFFIVLHKMPVKKALNAATDLFITNWVKILGLCLVLIVVFFAASSFGWSLMYFSRLAESASTDFDFLTNPAIMLMFRGVSAAILWAILGVLNVFFNSAFLILFLKLITPIKVEAEAEAKNLATSPAVP